MAPAGLGELGLWLHLRGRAGGRLRNLRLPAGTGPLLLMRACPTSAAAARQVTRALTKAVPALRILTIGAGDLPDIGDDPVAAPQLLDEAQPFALLLLGDALPPALIAAAGRADVPVILGDAHLQPQGWGLRPAMQRRLLAGVSHLLLADETSRAAALRLGVAADRITMTGPVSEICDPLPHVEAERAVMAVMLHRRHVWLAASVPQAEEDAVIEAHRAALRNSHRALLILTPADPARSAPLAEVLDAAGFAVALRSADQDPADDIQILLADDPQEMGLWYRLAPVTYMGGTLSAEADPATARQPFEPAALGSAIIHGPQTGAFPVEWRQLDGAQAAYAVADAAGLATAVADLSQPEQVARLAANAWSVSTGGAGVALQIAAPVLALLRKPAA